MSVFEEMSALLQKGRAKELTALIESELANGTNPKQILQEGLISGMGIVGTKFKNNEMFIPEVLIAARAMNMSLVILKPKLQEAGNTAVGKAIICTVKGDLHDIGKNLVKIMMEGNGIECIDLGVDVGADKVVAAIKEHKPQIVCLSALLTTTMLSQGEIIEAIKAAGLRDQVKVMIGGAPITQDFADQIGADRYTENAAEAAEVALTLF